MFIAVPIKVERTHFKRQKEYSYEDMWCYAKIERELKNIMLKIEEHIMKGK